MASTLGRLGDSEQTGSVAAASPASRRAWQRQPPKSRVRRSQVLQGACIQSSPRNFWNAGEVSQISRRLLSFTLANSQAGNHFSGVAGECVAVWRDEHEFAAPAAHAGFGIFRVVIGDYRFDADFSAQARFRAFDYFQRTI